MKFGEREKKKTNKSDFNQYYYFKNGTKKTTYFAININYLKDHILMQQRSN